MRSSSTATAPSAFERRTASLKPISSSSPPGCGRRSLQSYADEDFVTPYVEAGIELLELLVQRADGSVLLGCPGGLPNDARARADARGARRPGDEPEIDLSECRLERALAPLPELGVPTRW
jgi:hypothetical protein